ncbi:MAG: MraY family glycosyltransferase [Planctomycetota bacterium]
MPLLGGVAVLCGIVAGAAVAGLRFESVHPAALLAIAMAVLVGLLDDRRKDAFPLAVKLVGLAAAALLASCALPQVRVPSWEQLMAFAWCFTVLNAFNLSDNANGLSPGLAAIPFVAFALGTSPRALAADQQIVLATVAGASLGFLPFNYPRAWLFLGDGGSYGLGMILAVWVSPWQMGWLAPALIAVPLVDAAWVTLVRLRLGIAPWYGDRRHLSHRLMQAGWNPAAAVALLWLLGLAIAIVAIAAFP